ncbi:hypothetical protein [Hymenobacter norwichensis]|uniref:hypothetical protein n=1 Tax=Hymenobacter norwichensis TaxID=223903 RepID=UPI0003B7A4FD|nr:hypothetical protein [Hymenobacter norwichensis]
MLHLKNCLLLGLALVVVACSEPAPQQVRAERLITRKGAVYSLFFPQHLALDIVTTRPNPATQVNQLSVAAAYTNLQTGEPLDLLVYNGVIRQAKATVGFLDGVLTLAGDSCRISQVSQGQCPPLHELEQVSARRGTVLLQELLVFRGRNQRAVGGSLFQRRAIVELTDHRFAVAESASDLLTMHQFAEDLRELGAYNALYLDMGDWDEGWYKTGKQTVKLGHRRTETHRQSNWLVFAAPSSIKAAEPVVPK